MTDGVILLREWRDADAEPAAHHTRDPAITRFTRVPEGNTAEMVREAMIDSPPAAGEARFVIADPETEAMLGACGVLRPDVEAGRAELGYWVAQEHRGRGVAARAVELTSTWAFGRGFSRLELHIDPENAPSRRVAEKTGYALEGILRSYEVLKGRRVNVAMYARIAG